MVRKRIQHMWIQHTNAANMPFSAVLFTYIWEGTDFIFVFFLQSPARRVSSWICAVVRPSFAWNRELLGQPHFDATAGHECLLPARTCACCSLHFWHPVPKKMVELSTDLAVGIYCFRMTESFPSRENSPMNSHVRAKPLPSHQLKNNTLGFGKNAVLGVCVVSAFDPLRLCWCWVFRGLLHNWETSLQPAPEAEALRTSVRVRLSPIRLCNAANVCGSSKGLRNPRGPSNRQTKRISTPTVTSALEIPKVI